MGYIKKIRIMHIKTGISWEGDPNKPSDWVEFLRFRKEADDVDCIVAVNSDKAYILWRKGTWEAISDEYQVEILEDDFGFGEELVIKHPPLSSRRLRCYVVDEKQDEEYLTGSDKR